MQQESAFSYRNKKAAELVDFGDKKMNLLPAPNVLRMAKYQFKESQYLDSDPIKSLSIMNRQTTSGQNIIHGIGHDPFFCTFLVQSSKKSVQ